jgi:hypothetical protein
MRSTAVACWRLHFRLAGVWSSTDGVETPLFVADPFQRPRPARRICARAQGRRHGGRGFSAGSGDREIKFAEVSCSPGAPVKVVKFTIKQGDWPEQPTIMARIRLGYPLPSPRDAWRCATM